MILGLGIDLLENRRVEQELSQREWLQGDGIFTQGEIRYCNCAKRAALRYAACFAAKEATLKALGMGVRDLGMFREVELALGANHEYKIVLHDRLRAESARLGVRHIQLSIAHHAKQTAAVVILED
jgi:holo-[acyl-carrier protein] synthase